MLVRGYKITSLMSFVLWGALGAITIGSIARSPVAWGINLIMGLLFVMTGWFLYQRANNFYRYVSTNPAERLSDQHLKHFLLFDFVLVCITVLVGALLFVMSIFRVFMEGYAVFG